MNRANEISQQSAWTWSIPDNDTDTVRGSTKDGWSATVVFVANKGWNVSTTFATEAGVAAYGNACLSREHGMLTAQMKRAERLPARFNFLTARKRKVPDQLQAITKKLERVKQHIEVFHYNTNTPVLLTESLQLLEELYDKIENLIDDTRRDSGN